MATRKYEIETKVCMYKKKLVDSPSLPHDTTYRCMNMLLDEHSESGADIQRHRYVAAHVTSDGLNELLVLTSLEQNYKKLALTTKLN